MRISRAIAAAAALIGAGAAQAQAAGDSARAAFERDFCHGLERLVREAPDFVGVYNAKPAPPWLGFRPGSCRATAGSEKVRAGWRCHQQLAPAHLGVESLAAATAACLPQAKRLPRAHFRREAVFALPGLRLRMSENGGPGAKVGLISTYAVEEAR